MVILWICISTGRGSRIAYLVYFRLIVNGSRFLQSTDFSLPMLNHALSV
uniref:Uncharacterized protein n=1 Tax=Candidatus Kentrum sp. LFY TaxID=2126342 RepID=A0A450WML7_9GAMM|nr:MAG: hypothetical protein BECKLFY1418C_GA0070996_104018 [Candidatus Kentron sp. LFY]